MTQLDFFYIKGMEALPPWFQEYIHTAHGREIANKFIKLAYGLKKRGWKKYSHWAIAGRLRWHHDLLHGPDSTGFKINNNILAYLARFAMIREPELKGFFELRGLGKRGQRINESYKDRSRIAG